MLATIFVNAMLPGLGTEREVGVISGSGWAFGYAGGIVALAVMLFLLAENDAGRYIEFLHGGWPVRSRGLT